MTNTQKQEWYDINSLVKEYNIQRTALYTRLKKLSIMTEKLPGKGNQSYISSGDKSRLDKLDEHLKNTGSTFSNFEEEEVPNIINAEIIKVSEESPSYSIVPETHPESASEILERVLSAIVESLNPSMTLEEKTNFFKLAEKEQMFLTSKQIKGVLGKSPRGKNGIAVIESWKFINMGIFKRNTYWSVSLLKATDFNQK